jgi:exosortase
LGYVETSSLFGWLHWVYSVSPDEAHGQLVPFVVLGLFWWKRKELMAVPKQTWWPALGLVILALVLHILGYLIQQARLSVLGFFVGLYGLMGLVWGKAWLKACFFPYFLLAFCMPLGTLAESVTFPLRLLVTQLSVGISSLGLGIEVYREGTQIFGAQGFQFDMAPACSGIRSLIALLALTTIYGFMTFRALWKRLLMMALAFPLAVAGNVVRITTVIIVAEAFGEDAGATIEQKLGFVTFLVALIGIVAVGYWMRDRGNERIGNPKQWEGQTA